MLAVALLVALGAQASPQPAAVVVPIRVSSLSANEFMGLSLQVHQALAAGGVGLAMDPATALAKLGAKSEGAEACKAPEGCALALGKKLGATVIIALDATGSRKSCALHLEALVVADGVKLGELDLLSPRDALKDADRASLNAFAVMLAPKLAAMAPKLPDPPPPTDLPREADLRPPPPPDAPNLDIAKPAPASTGTSPAVIGTAVGAGVAAAAAIALGIVGYTEASQVPARGSLPPQTWPETKQHAATANTLYGSAAGAAGVAVVLATVAVVLQLTE